MNGWQVLTANPVDQEFFSTYHRSIDHEGEVINENWMSSLIRVDLGGKRFYVKSYRSRGRGLRKYLGRSRLRKEWENLLHFEEMGVPTVKLVAYGEHRTKGSYGGALITEELSGTRDLASLHNEQSPLLKNRQWTARVMHRLARAVRDMHGEAFIHNDLKWRNILVEVDREPQVYVIDCPQGRQLSGPFLAPFLARGIVKDLACLDKVGRKALTRSQRLQFYLAYREKDHLDDKDKNQVSRILNFFSGRE